MVIVSISFGGSIFILVLVVVVLKLKARARRNKKVDFQTMRHNLLESGDLLGQEGGHAWAELGRHEHAMNNNGGVVELRRGSVSMSNRQLGRGNFGEVFEATLTNGTSGTPSGSVVAVKSFNIENEASIAAAVAELGHEAAIMAHIGQHLNCVCLIGAVTKGVPKLLVIDYCENGSLKGLLEKRVKDRRQGPFTEMERLSAAHDVALGMDHLQSMRVIHRDLAARNVLVSKEMTCKVADFGLSRTRPDNKIYYESKNKQGGQIPLRWTAIEAMETGQFNTASDVWSFGVLVLEIYENGEMPYKLMANEEVIRRLLGGYRAPKPITCGSRVYDGVISRCWDSNPANRPQFKKIVKTISDLLDAHTRVALPQAAFSEQQHEGSGTFGVSSASDTYTGYSSPTAVQLLRGSTRNQQPQCTDSSHDVAYSVAVENESDGSGAENKYYDAGNIECDFEWAPDNADDQDNGARYTSVTQEVVDNAAQQVLGLGAGQSADEEYLLVASECVENGHTYDLAGNFHIHEPLPINMPAASTGTSLQNSMSGMRSDDPAFQRVQEHQTPDACMFEMHSDLDMVKPPSTNQTGKKTHKDKQGKNQSSELRERRDTGGMFSNPLRSLLSSSAPGGDNQTTGRRVEETHFGDEYSTMDHARVLHDRAGGYGVLNELGCSKMLTTVDGTALSRNYFSQENDRLKYARRKTSKHENAITGGLDGFSINQKTKEATEELHRHSIKYDELFDTWRACTWTFQLRAVHADLQANISAARGDQAMPNAASQLRQPNPWKGVDPNSEGYAQPNRITVAM